MDMNLPIASYWFRNPAQFLDLNINNRIVSFRVNPGAEFTAIPLSVKNKIFPELSVYRWSDALRDKGGHAIYPIGILKNLTVTYGGVTVYNQTLFILGDNYPTIIGLNWLNLLRLWPKFKPICNIRQNISLPFKSEWKPVSKVAKIIQFDLKERVNDEINRLLAREELIPVEASPWSAPVIPIVLQNDDVMLFFDYCATINKYLKNVITGSGAGLPSVCKIISILEGNAYFCVLKLLKNPQFFEIPLDAKSQELCTIVTTQGKFRPRYLPRTIIGAANLFIRHLDENLKGLDVVIIGEKLYIYGKTMSQASETLTSVIEIIEKMGLSINTEDSIYFAKSIEVFDMKIGGNYIKELKNSVKPLVTLPIPTNFGLLCSFIKLLDYFSHHLLFMKVNIEPLLQLRNWDDFPLTKTRYMRAFHMARRALEFTATAFNFETSDATLLLNCHATNVSIAAVLSVVKNNPKVKPIAFAGKKLHIREMMCSEIEKEALAVYYGVNKFYDYLWGRKFIVEIASERLASILRGHVVTSNPQLTRMMCRLIEFDYSVEVREFINASEYIAKVVVGTDFYNVP